MNTDTIGYDRAAVVVKDAKDIAGDNSTVGVYAPSLFSINKDAPGTAKNVNINKKIFANSGDTKPDVSDSVTTLNYLKVKPEQRSNFSSPVVAKGEKLKVDFTNGDIQRPKYKDTEVNETKRKTDWLKISINSKQDTDNAAADCYFLEFDSRDVKHIHLHTSKENGEEYAYDIILNAGESFLTILDDDGQEIALNSPKKQIFFKNKDDSKIDLIGRNINIECKDSCKIKCNKFEVDAKLAYKLNAKATGKLVSPTTIVDAASAMNINTNAMNISASCSCKIDSPITTCSMVFGAPVIGVSPAPGTPPISQTLSLAGASLSPAVRDVAANGAMVVSALTAMIPFTTLPPILTPIITPLLSQIPNPMVRI